MPRAALVLALIAVPGRFLDAQGRFADDQLNISFHRILAGDAAFLELATKLRNKSANQGACQDIELAIARVADAFDKSKDAATEEGERLRGFIKQGAVLRSQCRELVNRILSLNKAIAERPQAQIWIMKKSWKRFLARHQEFWDIAAELKNKPDYRSLSDPVDQLSRLMGNQWLFDKGNNAHYGMEVAIATEFFIWPPQSEGSHQEPGRPK